jgi:large subunit ribosomal protein L10
MSKELKSLIRDELVKELEGLEGGVFVGFTGLDSARAYQLRSSLHRQGVSLRVLHNRLTIRALEELGIRGVSPAEVFRSPTAIVYGETVIDAARALRTEIRQSKAPLTIKGGLIEGELLDGKRAETIADLPTREEVLAQIAGGFQGGAQRIAGCFQQTYRQLSGLFQALAEELDAGDGKDSE